MSEKFYGKSELTSKKPKYISDLYNPESIRLLTNFCWKHTSEYFNIKFGKLIMKNVTGNIDRIFEYSEKWENMPEFLEISAFQAMNTVDLLDFKILNICSSPNVDFKSNKGFLSFYNKETNHIYSVASVNSIKYKNKYFDGEIEFIYKLKDKILRLVKYKNKKCNIKLFKTSSINILIQRMKCMDVLLVNNQIEM